MELKIIRHDIPNSSFTAFLMATGQDVQGKRFKTHVCYKPGEMREGVEGLADAILGKGLKLMKGPSWWTSPVHIRKKSFWLGRPYARWKMRRLVARGLAGW